MSTPPGAGRNDGQIAYWSIQRATELTCLVRDEGREDIGRFLDRLDRQALYGLAVTLAAMVPDDRTVDELLAWVDPAWAGAA